MLRTLFIAFLLVVSSETDAQHHKFEQIGITEGLPGRHVIDIDQDEEGYLWVNCVGELFRFDGTTFELDPLLAGIPIVDFQIRANEFWVCGKYSFYQRKADTLETVHQFEGFITDYEFDSQDRLWVAAGGELWMKEEQGGFNLNPFFKDSIVQELTIHNDTVFVLTRLGIYKLTDQEPQLVWEGLQPGEIFYSIFHDGDKIWTSSSDGVRWHRQNEVFFEPYETPNRIGAIMSTADGNLWFIGGRGVVKYNDQTEEILVGEDLFLDEKVQSILYDAEEVLWFATETGGLFKLLPTSLSWIDKQKGLLSDVVYGVSRDTAGALWVGTEQGLYTDSKSPSALAIANNAPNPAVYAVHCDQKGNVWIGGFSGVFKISDGTLTRKVSQQSTGLVWRIVEDSKGNVWCATIKGLLKFEDDKYHWVLEDEGYKGKECHNVFEDSKGRIWIAFVDRVVVLIDDELVATNHQVEDGTWFSEDAAGNVWVSTFIGGIYKTAFDGNEIKVIEQLDESNVLPTNTVYNVYVANDSTIYAGSLKGLVTIKVDSGYTVTDILTDNDGFAGTECNRLYLESDTTLLYSTIGGLVHFDPTKNRKNQTPPRFRITELWIEDSLRFEQSNLPSVCVLSEDERNLRIKFRGITPRTPKRITYEYRLLGFRDDWVSSGGVNQANFTNIPHGEYVFEVRAINESGVYSNESTKLPIEVRPKVYETTWFFIVLILFFIGVFMLIAKWFFQRARKKDQARAALAELKLSALQTQLNPHFIFNCLNSIQSIFNAGKTTLGNTYIAKFSFLLRKVFEASGNKSMALSEEVLLLKAYIALENLRFSERIKFEFEFDDELDDEFGLDLVQIPPMLIQPLIENAIKHGLKNGTVAGTIKISFSMDEEHLTCTVGNSGGEPILQNKTDARTSALDVIVRRIELLGDTARSKAHFSLFNESVETENWTKASLKIPLDL